MRGFTLIETIIYIALISVILTMTLLATIGLLETKNRTAARLEVEEEANFLMGKIGWALAGARAVTAPAAGATSTALTVEKFNFAQNPITFDLADGAVRIRYGSAAPTPLLSESAIVQNLVFEHITGGGNPAMKIVLSLEVNPQGPYAQYPAQTVAETTIALRKQ